MSAAPKLRTFGLVMLTLVAVDSVRNLPTAALFGTHLPFFFMVAAIFFLFPTAFVASFLAANTRDSGGIYQWVKQAFGKKWGAFAVYLQWVENVVWYPTMLSFVIGVFSYVFYPEGVGSKTFIFVMVVGLFWLATLINLTGVRFSAKFSTWCAMLGLVVPMLFLIALGGFWVWHNMPLALEFNSGSFIPHGDVNEAWSALTGVMLSFCGMELVTVFGRDTHNPQRTLPMALTIAVILIFVSMLFGSLAIAIVLPKGDISLLSGLMQAYEKFFAAYGLQKLLPVFALLVAIGGLGGVNAWIIGPTEGLCYAAQDGQFAKHYARLNHFNSPRNLLIAQAALVTVLATVFLFAHSINSSYWILTDLASLTYMSMYIIMFITALKFPVNSKQTSFLLPGGKKTINCLAVMGIIGASVTIFVGFFQPDTIQSGINGLAYALVVAISLGILMLPWLWMRREVS